MREVNSSVSDYMNYTISTGVTSVVMDYAFLTVDSNDSEATSAELLYTAAPYNSGTYADTLTFTVKVGEEI